MCLKQEIAGGTSSQRQIDLDLIVNCLICSNLMQAPTTMHCGHSFCRTCTVKWCVVYKHYTCPVCRKPLDKKLPSVNVTLKTLIELLKQKTTTAAAANEETDVELYNQMNEKIARTQPLLNHAQILRRISNNIRNRCDSSLSRISLFNVPVYLFLAFWGFILLFVLNFFKRLLK